MIARLIVSVEGGGSRAPENHQAGHLDAMGHPRTPRWKLV